MNLSKKSIDMLISRKFIDKDDIETTNINIMTLFKNCQYIQDVINGNVDDFDYHNPTDEILNLLDNIQNFLQCLKFETEIVEICPYCDTETKISSEGGYCEHCGKWVKPCSLCNMDKVNCNECPYADNHNIKDIMVIELKDGTRFRYEELETVYNKYVQNNTPNVDEYYNKKEKYTLKDFVNDINKNNIELCVYKNKVDLIQAYFVEDMSKRDLAQFIYNLSTGIKELQPIEDDPDIVVLNKDTGNEKFVWIKEN